MEAIQTALADLTASISTATLSTISTVLPTAAPVIAGIAVVSFGLRFVRRVTRG